MPKKQNGMYYYWYSFIVPTDKVEHFYNLAQTIKKSEVKINHQDDVTNHTRLFDISFISQRKGMPALVRRLMDIYQGVEVSARNLRSVSPIIA